MDVTGFILQASYRITAGVPVVYLFGKLTNGQTFLVRDRRTRPHFYVESSSSHAALTAGAVKVEACLLRSFTGTELARVEVAVPQDAPKVRDGLHDRGLSTYEADVRLAVRYLIDRGIKGGCRIQGEGKAGDGVDWLFDEPELSPSQAAVSLKTLPFDIETDAKAQQLLAISLYAESDDQVRIDPLFVHFDEGDVVRHPVVRRIIEAYERSRA